MLKFTSVLIYQGRNQDCFMAKEVSWNKGTSINTSPITHERKTVQ